MPVRSFKCYMLGLLKPPSLKNKNKITSTTQSDPPSVPSEQLFMKRDRGAKSLVSGGG